MKNPVVIDARYLQQACHLEAFRSGIARLVDMNKEQQQRVIEQAVELQAKASLLTK